ncbi:putative ribonucleotide reductase of class Ib subunit beta [Salmonella phage 19]|nr:putative ribonucleotide reductase of class Ib subunit beta [Salmonella phage 19]
MWEEFEKMVELTWLRFVVRTMFLKLQPGKDGIDIANY